MFANMEVIGADGVHVGTVDHVDGDRIKLTRTENIGAHEGHHHFISRGLVAEVEGRQGSPRPTPTWRSLSRKRKAAPRQC